MPNHYAQLVDPTVYPDYRRRPIRVPTWSTFGNTTQLITLRGFEIRDNRLVDYEKTLDTYVEKHKLGRIIWPNFSNVYAENFNDLVMELKKRGLFLFDIWGHVPGSEPIGWGHLLPLPGQVKYLERTLGGRFLGFDNGEQDGRYVGGYASTRCPAIQDRFRQYLNFQRHFERLGDDMGNNMSALVSLCYGHYFIKENNHVLLGAETAQALPNSQIYYAFIRGACKQYGILWFGNASVYNRWSWKDYAGEGGEGAEVHGPTKGAGTNLLKRLMYTHYLYNCMAVGFESGWFMKDGSLSPIGHIQAAVGRFIEEHGQPGTMHAPVALLLDHFAGWCVPRHLYTGMLYQVWGAMPYDAGDYLTHGVLSVLYPGYEDASYFHDERGFLSPTPHGDMADCLLSDVPAWVLARYGLVVAAGRLGADPELRDKLEGFVKGGGHLVVTAENARLLWPEWQIGPAVPRGQGAEIRWSDGRVTVEPAGFALCSMAPPDDMRVLASCGDRPAVAELAVGSGRITLILSPFGLNEQPDLSAPVKSEIEKPLPCPFSLLAHVRQTLSAAFSAEQIFSVGRDLSFITCRRKAGEYLLGIHNNGLSERPFKIVSHAGEIEQVSELPLDQSEKGAVGYWPEEFQKNDPGRSGPATIAGGDIRIFAIRIRETNVRVLEPVEPPRRRGTRLLAFRDIVDLKTEILARPTFFQHFDGVKIDWTYLHIRDRKQVKREAGWLKRQKVRLLVDFSPGLDFYPDLTLLDAYAPRYEESVKAVDDCLDKMKTLGATEAVICLHRNAENHVSVEQAKARFLGNVADLCKRAARRRVALYLQPSVLGSNVINMSRDEVLSRQPGVRGANAGEVIKFIDDVNAVLGPGFATPLRFALNTSHANGQPLEEIVAAAGNRLGLALLSAPVRDIVGQQYDAHRPLKDAGMDLAALADAGCALALDGNYLAWADVYADIAELSAVWRFTKEESR